GQEQGNKGTGKTKDRTENQQRGQIQPALTIMGTTHTQQAQGDTGNQQDGKVGCQKKHNTHHLSETPRANQLRVYLGLAEAYSIGRRYQSVSGWRRATHLRRASNPAASCGRKSRRGRPSYARLWPPRESVGGPIGSPHRSRPCWPLGQQTSASKMLQDDS